MSNFIGNNINDIRIHFGLSQEKFAEAIGTSQTTVSAWECGESTPRKSNVEKMIGALPQIQFDDIMSEERGFAKRVNGKTQFEVEVPLLSRIAAGTPLEMEDYEDSFPIPERLHDKYPEAFLLRVDGESMNRIIPNGCYALVDPCDEVLHDGKPYAICVNGYDATIKRVHKLNNGFELIPDSNDPTYSKTTYNFNDPQTDPVTVIGEVVHYVLPYDWGF